MDVAGQEIRLQRTQQQVPPWPGEIEAVRSVCFPEWYLADHIDQDLAWLVTATHDDKVIGYAQADAGIDPSSCYLREIAVLVDYRRQGIGRRLIGNLASWLQQTGFTMIYAYPLDDDLVATRVTWFETMGFSQPDPYTTHAASLDALLTNCEQVEDD